MPSVLRSGWVGRRVSVRRVVDQDENGRVRFGDVVGDLLALDATTATIETRNGLVEVPVAHIAIARDVPPSTAETLALEAISAQGWRARETAEVGGWLLRADGGFTDRANSALPLGRPQSLNDTMALARAWYAERGLPFKIVSPLPARRLLDNELSERGFDSEIDTHMLAARVDQLELTPSVEFTITDQPDADWLGAYHYRGRTGGLPDGARELISRHDRALFLSVRDGNRTIAIGRGAVDDGWVGITAVEVDPDHRRTGLGRAVLAGLVQAAHDRYGASRVYLQVSSDNQPAISLYLGLGFWHHHDYRYRTEVVA
jgi:GNAT superfamily N-acetyltransferase